MEKKIATLEKSLCQGIANKRRNIEVYCKQAEKYKDWGNIHGWIPRLAI